MIKNFLKSELGKGALILFITMNVFNLLNFLFHFSMGRLLGPANYGILAVLMSLVYIYGVPSEALQTFISRYTSRLNVKQENKKIKFLMIKTLKKGFLVSLFLFLLGIPLAIFLSNFLKINMWLIILTNVFLFFSFSIPVTRGILQGKKRFNSLGMSFIAESGLKLILAISLVILGFEVFGAILGLFIGLTFGLFVSIYFNKDILEKKEEIVHFEKIYSRSIPYFITMLVILLVFSLDILLAKRFFSPELAGQYAVISMMGKMVFLGTVAISKAMFPLVSEKKDSNQYSGDLLKKSIFVVGGICLIINLAFALFPKLIIWLLYGAQYLEMAPYLIYTGIAFSFLSLSNIILIYGLSIERLDKSYLLFVFVLIELSLLFIFKDNILEFVRAFMISNIIMFIGSVFFTRK